MIASKAPSRSQAQEMKKEGVPLGSEDYVVKQPTETLSPITFRPYRSSLAEVTRERTEEDNMNQTIIDNRFYRL